jgi:hypothetical protein
MKNVRVPLFCFTKVCLVRFFALQKFVLSAFLPYKSL